MLEISVSQKMTMMTPSYRFDPMSTWDYANMKMNCMLPAWLKAPHTTLHKCLNIICIISLLKDMAARKLQIW